jgi:hypothetical protein
LWRRAKGCGDAKAAAEGLHDTDAAEGAPPRERLLLLVVLVVVVVVVVVVQLLVLCLRARPPRRRGCVGVDVATGAPCVSGGSLSLLSPVDSSLPSLLEPASCLGC